MALRLYLDEDSMDRRVFEALRRSGIDVIRSGDAGNRHLADELQLEYATQQGRAIYTANVRHFARIHRNWMAADRTHGGIILRYSQRLPVGEQIRGLTRICQSVSEQERLNFYDYIEGWLRER
ncbi:MAG: hypothetical protein C0506_15375 [Anaerolinea sp.]|nr:hypothetical protein [Anaerolinea sp.]